jgi:hypothetical protein
MEDNGLQNDRSEDSILEGGLSKYELRVSHALEEIHQLQDWKEQGILEEQLQSQSQEDNANSENDGHEDVEELFIQKISEWLK